VKILVKKDYSFALHGREILNIRIHYPLHSDEDLQRYCHEKYAKMKRELRALREKYKGDKELGLKRDMYGNYFRNGGQGHGRL
jgi:hypothetical protein